MKSIIIDSIKLFIIAGLAGVILGTELSNILDMLLSLRGFK